MKLVIVTGMSGSGKSTALKFLEDMGFYCVDNLPPQLIDKFVDICIKAGSEVEYVALGIDVRGWKTFKYLDEYLCINKESIELDILFLDCSDSVLLQRYKETRRNHPLSTEGRIINGIEREREFLKLVKFNANYVIDTTYSLNKQLKEKLLDIFMKGIKFNNLMITILSFGFKYGIPQDSDLVFDVRFIPNPYYLSELKELTGNNAQVKDYVLKWQQTKDFIYKLHNMLDFLIPNYIKEGKNQLVISIGCTGGKHRSVTVANELYNYLSNKNLSVTINHHNILN